jgi:hypothetical protein
VEKPLVPETNIAFGLMEIKSFNVDFRQMLQFSISIFVVEFQAGMLAGQQEDIVREISFHLLAIANFSIAGNHDKA